MDNVMCRYLSRASRCLGRPVPSYVWNMPSFSSRCGPKPRLQSSLSTPNTEMDSNTVAATSVDDTFNPRFLVVSLGNPAPYGESLHSTGHLALRSLQHQLHRDHNQPQFESERIAKKATQTSRGSKYTLLQCPTLMNISGPWVAKAWKELLAESGAEDANRPMGLVVVHDELEEDMCVVKVRKWERSHRGHNGLKSIMATMQPGGYKDSKWAKISVGIGRPEGRDQTTVADYVLKPWSKYQKETIFQKTGLPVLAALNEIEATWEAERKTGTTEGSGKSPKPTKKGKKQPRL